jgi:large subunit ribosomal protein L2
MYNQSINHLKPATPGQRFTRLINKQLLLKLKPLKQECVKIQKHSGRNHSGQITVSHRGGGHPKRYRKLDFFRHEAFGIVEGLEHDPYRNAWIQRTFNPDKHYHHYILGVKDLKAGHIVRNFQNAKLKSGHHKLLQSIPLGYVVHNLSTARSKKGQYLRAAGTYGQVLQKTKTHARIKLRSGEHRLFPLKASASLGAVICEDAKLVKIGKAGRKRWMGLRPKVRGVAMNPVDHPHGGGEGKTSGGRPSVTPWGKPTKGQPTVKKHNFLRLVNRKKNK